MTTCQRIACMWISEALLLATIALFWPPPSMWGLCVLGLIACSLSTVLILGASRRRSR